MTMTLTPTSLCVCRHIKFVHDDTSNNCMLDGCHCTNFILGSRKSAARYQRGQSTYSERVAQIKPGDVVLVGYPGRVDYVRDETGLTTWVQQPGSVTSTPVTERIQDHVLRPTKTKTGALLARVTGRDVIPSTRPPGWPRSATSMHIIHTDMGDLPAMFGRSTVLVLTGGSQ